jgi:hypothetical protein
MKNTCIIILAALIFPVSVSAETLLNSGIETALAEVKIPDQGVLADIFGSPAAISIGVKKDAGDDGASWIRMEADLHVTTDATIEQLRRIITDYNNYSRST